MLAETAAEAAEDDDGDVKRDSDADVGSDSIHAVGVDYVKQKLTSTVPLIMRRKRRLIMGAFLN